MASLDSALRKPPGDTAPPYRAAPHNIEAEQALLGAVLVNNEALYRVSDFLEPEHFFEPIHRQIYDISRSLIRTGKLASPVTLKTFLPAEIDIAGLTLAQYLARLAAEATTIINAVDYGRTIYDLALRREVINIGEEMVNVARASRGAVRADGHIDTVNGGIVGFFSLEMSAEQLATRIIAERSGIPSSTIRRGGINERDFEKIKDVAIELQHLPFFIDETGGLTVAQLAARARRLKRQKGLDLLVIDYIQLLQGSTRRAMEGRVQEVTEITTSLKALAKELNVPVVALSQLSRQVENRDDKRPQLSDLREAGSIEQDADVVLFVFREEYYLSNKEPRPGTDDHTRWQVEMA